MKKWKIEILSPDGFTIEREVPYYKSHIECCKALDKWMNGYKTQGYYSSVKYGKIPFENLVDFCRLNYL